MRDEMSGAKAEELGRMAAVLHSHASATRPVKVPPILIANRVLYWRAPNLLPRASQASMLVEALERATNVLEALWTSPPSVPHLVHGDLTPANVLVHAGELRPIDFQDLVWGLDVWDLSISLASFSRFDDADGLRERFHRGYATVRPWPDVSSDVMAALIAARRLHQLNLTLMLDRSGAALAVERITRSIADWMQGSG
jgi:Ser/Thr protein kinase RdoA (MazF antagonist)